MSRIFADRALVVCGDVDLRAQVARLLEGECEVQFAATTEEAMAMATVNPPDVLVWEGSRELALPRSLRSDARTLEVPLIVLSRDTEEEALIQALDAGASDFILLPFRERSFQARTGAHIKAARGRRLAQDREAILRLEARTAKEQAASVLESIADGFFTLDKDWCFTYVNGAGEKLLGAPAKDLMGKSHWELYPAALGTVGEHEYFRAVREQVAVSFDIHYEPWNRWFAVKAYPTEQGGISVFLHDITEQKRFSETLRESEERFRTLADNIPNLAWMAHGDGNLFWYNKRWVEYTGKSLEQMEGWGWQEVHDPAFLSSVMERWQESLRTGTNYEMEFPLRGKDGKFRWFLTQVRPVRNEAGEVIRWFGTNTNIDDKRRAEEALRQSEALARSVIEGNPDGVKVLDVTGKTLLINEQGRIRRGACNAPADASWLDSWSGKDREHAGQAFEAALAGRQAHFEASATAVSGAPLLLEISVTPLLNERAEVSRVLCIVRDVTAARRAEEQLRQTAKLESLGVMAGGIAHDFNNLLTGILGNASLLAETVNDSDRPLAEDIALAAERAADLTKQMLAYSGKGRFEVAHTDLSGLVREMLRLVRPSIDKTVEVRTELQDDCILECDPGQIQQVIMNLIINAGEAMEGRAGLVNVRTEKVIVDSTYIAQTFGTVDSPPGEYVLLEVSDNGKGMDDKTRARIFDPFYTTKFTGRGLGLAAVSGIVRGHQGMLRVYSEPGEGTTFKVLFPSVGGTAGALSKSEIVTSRGHGTILLADDEEIVRRVGQQVLQRHGYQVRVACDGKEALDLFAAHHKEIDAVVLDMTMPVMTGEEALKGMQAIDANVSAIVCSGYNEVEVIRRFTNDKVGAFLQKPYTASQLLEIVHSTVQKN